ncbi:23S rRNA (adenine(1618)-N(6))-methyltransferase RlmF [Flavobacterium sp. NKUCC04_CG]|uniref:23S rRNA (adenine(1618)-N(6))-methyltransferase RlmF n=1 Tax=Flavobacterium sp. NKUCC04_CG TaxID=2842121 RepID=UPI001C5BD95B|nr:23S rRNA (adenine(1618)-N(6))-methyltransferase RlmF [Flavobacterium sp. NKUCC04_CG]MBW3519961.1 23S rRNA (adenine(1618)-N(6))-methyltransferase RlmF [Flavobacterium sp. NKUCC04_CG]
MKDSSPNKKKLHPRNKHNKLYDFDRLKAVVPELIPFIIKNPSGVDTIDFSKPEAVVLLNKALLMSDYKLTYWELPKDNLCPPIPGRADYIHYVADLLATYNAGVVPTGNSVKILDLGVGANAIYPIIGVAEYGWRFVASDINKESLASAENIVSNNPHLKSTVSVRLQPNARNILENIIGEQEQFTAVICNPPFFKSQEDAAKQSARKIKNLGKKSVVAPTPNFGGQSNELWCEGGELTFITNYIYESRRFGAQVKWFTTLVSDQNHLKSIQRLLHKVGATEMQIIEMEQGNKISRIVAWKF